jgi:hypothetical protein
MVDQCSKCSHESEDNLKKFGLPLCKVCVKFAPNEPEQLDEFVQEKVQSSALDSFRKYAKTKNELLKQGMIKKAAEGKAMSRPPFGYKYKSGKLIPTQNHREVEEIFETFLNNKISLRKLAEQHSFSVNGLKKILRNFTYIGKIKFNGQIHDSEHQPIVSSTLFNHVQNKMDQLKIKRN